MRTRLEILACIEALIGCMNRTVAETEHVRNLMAKYKGYSEFRGNKRLNDLHKAFRILQDAHEELRSELNALPYEIWLTKKNNESIRIARGFDTIASAEAWIAKMDHGQGRFDIYHIS